MKVQQKLKQAIRYTFECLIAIFMALEISQPPNPYKTHLIVLLSLYICLKHDIPNRILDLYSKAFKWLKEQSNIGTIR